MKKIVLTHLLVNVYMLAIIQPIYPVLDYIVNYDYIVDQLCENRDKPILACNGKCYLENQFVENKRTTGDDPKPMPPAVDLEKILTISPTDFSYVLDNPRDLIKLPLMRQLNLPTIYFDPLLRPPIF